MTMFRMPLSVWSLFITSVLVLLATPVLASAVLMNLLEHQTVAIGGNIYRLASFFTPFNWTLSNQIQGNAGGGFPILHQHIFWFYSHPAVYIMILPAMGMVSDIMAVFARKPVFGYRPMVYAMAGIAFPGLHRVGAPHVPIGHEPDAWHHVRHQHDVHCRAVRYQNL